MIEYLKIKCKSLAEEASIIRKEENKFKALKNEFVWRQKLQTAGLTPKQVARIERKLVRVCHINAAKMNKPLPKNWEDKVSHATKAFWGLRDHRRSDVRTEARSANIAYGFLRGHTYASIEQLSFSQPDWERIQRLIVKYSGEDERIVLQRFAAWKDMALNGVKEDPVVTTIRPRLGRPASQWSRNWEWVQMQLKRNSDLNKVIES